MSVEALGQKTPSDLSLKPVILQAIAFTLFVVLAVFLGGLFLREPLEAFAHWVVTELGLLGVFLGVIATDAFTVPIPPDTYLFVAVASKTPVIPILSVVCVASILAGNIAYRIGPYIQRLPFVHRRIERFRPRGEQLFLRYGMWTVAIAALTPIPFSVTCWFAGMYRMPYLAFLAATFARVPRLLGYYGLFLLGWAPPVL